MRLAPLLLLLVVLPLRADDLGLKVPPNFRVTLWADHTLANDIYTMCLDEKGRVVVSGPGYIRRLEDTKGLGKADKATDIAGTTTGAMGLLFAESWSSNDKYRLFTSADGKAAELRLDDATGKYEPGYDLWTPFPSSEHGGHALKIGPDARIYAVAGNDGRLGQATLSSATSVSKPEAGGILRLRPTAKPDVEIIADGFRNPYDFDFTPLGDMITFDSDTERDYGLPWYSPTRVYHVMPGAHHGWRLTGGMRSLARRDYYPDTVPILADMGRGSPTGVCCYRHTQFPAHYRGGVFLLDWTFGRVYYMPLIPEGSSYKAIKPELFLEAVGTNGFSPTAIRVAPDGSLFISVGGRGTRGAVYRIEYLADGKRSVIPKAEPENDVDRVLDAPQPLEAWSQANWLPLAHKVGDKEFISIAIDERESDSRRVRAIEVMIALFVNRFDDSAIRDLSRSKSPFVRARLAWMLRYPYGVGRFKTLIALALDPNPRVAAEAVGRIADALTSRAMAVEVSLELKTDWIIPLLDHQDQRVRLAATRLLANLPDDIIGGLERRTAREGTVGAMVSILASSTADEKKNPRPLGELLPLALRAQELARSSDEKRDALRAIMIALGDWKLANPPLELFSAYALRSTLLKSPGFHRILRRETTAYLRKEFPSADPLFNIEASRLLAMFEDDDPSSVAKVLTLITETSHPTCDFHYLTVRARLTSPWNEAQTGQVCGALLALDKKFAERNLRVEGNYPPRLRELVGELTRQHPALDKVLAAHADLVTRGNVLIAAKLTGDSRKEAAKRFLTAVRDNAEFPLTGELIDLLATLPVEDTRPVFRARWTDRPSRELLVKQLAAKPEEIDRGKFLDVLEMASGETVSISLKALESLPREESPKNLVPLLARLRQAFSDPKEAGIRTAILNLINRQAGRAFATEEKKTDSASLSTAYRPIFEWFEKTHPAEAKRLTASGEDEAAIRQMLPGVKWEGGDVERGSKLFRERGCHACHGGTTRLGPDLAGVGKRFSRDDLLTAIVNPSRDVAPAYRVTNLDTKDGKRISGIIVYDSNEALLVQTGTGETKRVAYVDIESRSPSPKSLMPDGLLKGMKPEELADLFAFLGKQ